MRTEIKLGTYQHFKGHKYKVIGLAKHSETLEDLVIYQALDDSKQLWARPRAMFSEALEVDGQKISRFTFLE